MNLSNLTVSSMVRELNNISMENACHQYLLNLINNCPVCEVELDKKTKMAHIQSHTESASVKKIQSHTQSASVKEILSKLGTIVPLFTKARAKIYVLEGILNNVNLSDDEKKYYNDLREEMQKALFFS